MWGNREDLPMFLLSNSEPRGTRVGKPCGPSLILIRDRGIKTVRKGGGVADMERQFKAMLHDCERHVNTNYDVSALCRAFPTRLAELTRAHGERLNH